MFQSIKSWFNPRIIHLGRWRTEPCQLQINRKVELANEDHCGPCGAHELSVQNPPGNPTKFAPIPNPAPERALAPIDGK